MSKAYQSIKQGILEAIDYASGKPIKAVVHRPLSSSEIEAILATRELVEPEPELRPEIVAKLKQKMALRQTP